MTLHARLFPLLALLLACGAATASTSDRPTQAAVHHLRSATTSAGNSFGQCAVTTAEYGDGCAATRTVSHHSLGQGATEAEDALLLASSNSAITSSSALGEATEAAAAVAEEEASEAHVSSKRAAEAKDSLPLCRSFSRGTTSSATSGYKAAAQEAIDSVVKSRAADGKEPSSAWSSGDKAADVSATAAVGSTSSRAEEVKGASSVWAGDKPAATAAVGFCCAEEGKEAERLLGSITRGTTPLTSVEEAAAAAEEAAAAAHPSTQQMGTSAWGTASPTTPRSPGGKDTLRPSLVAPFQMQIAAGTTSPRKSLQEMAMQPPKRMSTHQKLPVMMQQKKQERSAVLPSYFSGGLTAATVFGALIVAAILIGIGKLKRNAVVRSTTHCNRCFMRPIHWLPMCCRYGYCSHCLALVMMRHHRREWADEPPSVYFCTRRGPVGVVKEMGDASTFFQEMLPVREGFERETFPPWFLNDVQEISHGGETFTVLWYKNLEDCRSRQWPRRRRVIFRHVGDHAVERIGDPEDLPPLIEYSD